MKKKWYRSNLVKVILVVILLGALALGTVCGVMAFVMEDMGIHIWEESGTYMESEALSDKMFSSSREILNGLKAENMLSGQGTEGTKRVIDLQEYLDGADYTFQNTSGLAYSLEDLVNWADSSLEYTGYGVESVIVCIPKNEDESVYYYYYDQFCEMVENGEIEIELEGPELSGELKEDAIKKLLEEFKYVHDAWYDIKVIRDKSRNTEYENIRTPENTCIIEKYSPAGAESLLAAVNENPKWQGRLGEAYEALDNVLRECSGLSEEAGVFQENYQEGDTNLTYLYIDLDGREVYTNNSAFSAKPYEFGKYEDWLQEMSQMGAYAILKPKLGECISNMNFHDNSGLMTWQHTVEQAGFYDNYVFAVAVDGEFPIEDDFAQANRNYEKYAVLRIPLKRLFVLALLLFPISLIWLTIIAGKRVGDEDVHLNGFDRIYTEFAAAGVLVLGFVVPLEGMWFAGSELRFSTKLLQMAAAGEGLYMAAVFLAGYLSLVRRIKGRTLWKNSILCRLFRAAGVLLKKMGAVLELYSRNTLSKVKITLLAGTFFFLQFILQALIFWGRSGILILLVIFDLAVLLYLLWKADGMDRILEGLKRISGGELQYKIPTERMKGDQKTMAEYINNIGSGLDAAVDNSLKNERMKTELITNVSHDIKTPLTSIINYVDLLKRENFTDPKVCGYLDVLEEKAQRLKVLTEDVVEASKASSGTLKLEMVNLNFAEMLHQVMGEFAEKFEERNLTLMVHLTEEPVLIRADGRRLWRVLENVFNNVVKYALEGTRVYVQTTPEKGRVVFSLKNISAQPLNISADELTERFIRGDVSRNTEGSGLGLSIAKSLTELQGGDFGLYLDGDLFKVVITFPLVKAEEKSI